MNQNPVLPPYESHVVSGFCGMTPASLDSLNDMLGTRLSPALLMRMAALYRDTEQRDPTVGELRFADALDRLTSDLPDRCGAGKMTTDSADAAAVWADVMNRRRVLNGGGSSPLTVRELLSLTDRWLTRTGERPLPDKRLFAGSDALAACKAAGCRPALRFRDGLGTERLLGLPLRPVRPKDASGDLLLLVRGVPPRKVFTLTEEGPLRPVDAVVLDGRPLPSILCGMVSGISIISERLFPDADCCAAALADPRTFASPAPLCTLLLRVAAPALRQSVNILMNEGLHPLVFGRVQNAGRMEITRGGQRIVNLGMTFLRSLTEPRLCAIRLPAPADAPAPVTLPPVFSLPSAYAGEEGLTPDGLETVSLTSSGSSVTGYGIAAYTAACNLPEVGAETAARNVLLAAAAGAIAQGVRPQTLTLSVSLTGKPPVNRRDAMPQADSTVFAAACGLYRAAAELCLPMCDSDVRFTEEPARLSVTAWGPDTGHTHDDSLSGFCGTQLMLYAPAPSADGSLDYAEVRALLHALNGIDDRARLLPLCRDGRTIGQRLEQAAAGAGVSVGAAPALRELSDTCPAFAFIAECPKEFRSPGVRLGYTVSPAPLAGEYDADAAYLTGESDEPDTKGTLRISPEFRSAVLPLLHRSREADVNALAAALRKQGFVCTLLPLAVTMTQPEKPAETDAPAMNMPAETAAPAEDAPAEAIAPTDNNPAETAAPAEDAPAEEAPPAEAAPAAIPMLTDESADLLIHHFRMTAAVPVLAMPAEDVEIILRHPRASAAVLQSYRLIAVGSACRVLAAHKLLPDELTCAPQTVPAAGQTLPLTISGGSTPNRLTRLCRTDLLAYSTDAPHLVTIYADGRAVPDGFVGLHKYVGFVNGFPDGFRL